MSSDDLIEQYIDANTHHRGAEEARLKRYGVSVWALIGYLQAWDFDVGRAARAYGVPLEAVEAALAYYRCNKDVIDARIAQSAA